MTGASESEGACLVLYTGDARRQQPRRNNHPAPERQKAAISYI